VATQNQGDQFNIPQQSATGSRVLWTLITILVLGGIAVGAYFIQKNFFSEQTSQGELQNEAPQDEPPTDAQPTVQTDTGDVDAGASSLIDTVTMAEGITDDYAPIDPTDVFPANAPNIYLTLQTRPVEEGTQIRSEWRYLTQDTFIGELSYVTKKGINAIAFTLPIQASGTWPLGEYEVRVFVDGSLASVVPFTVE